MHLRTIFLFAALAATPSLLAQTQTNTVRQMTLQECVDIALQHNIDIQISRYQPIIDQYSVEAAYGAYDPSFNTQAKETFKDNPGGFDPNTGLQSPANQAFTESFLAGIGSPTGGDALTPWGMKYGLKATLDRNSGTQVFGGVPVQRPFEYDSFAGIDLAQPLLKNFWIDSTREQIQLNKKTVKSDEFALRQQVLSTVATVAQAYYELTFDYENIKVEERAVQLAEQLVAENKRRVEVGSLAPLDEKQAESQAATSRADLINARNILELQQNTLKGLLSPHFGEWNDIQIMPSEKLLAVPERMDLQESWRRGLTQRPDLMQSKVTLEKQDIILKFDKNQLFPELDLVGSYGRNGLKTTLEPSLNDIREENFPQYSYGVTLSFPLSNKTARNTYKSDKVTKEQSLLKYKKLEDSIMIAIRNDIANVENAFARIKSTREAREYAELALEAEQKKLANGKSTSFNVLQLQSNLTTAASNEIRALADYNKALAQLALDQGDFLKQNNLNITFK